MPRSIRHGNAASSPIKLVDPVWLVLNPKTFDLGQIAIIKNPSGGFLHVQAVLTSTPKVALGSQPPAVTTPRPPLNVASEANAFHLNLRGLLSLDEMEKKTNTFFQANPIEHLEVSQIRLFGVDNGQFVGWEIVFRMAMKENFRLEWLREVKFYEKLVDDLDFTEESQHFLLNAAVDIASRFTG
jgi:hypothetical protein